jgi:hypothetical protein
MKNLFLTCIGIFFFQVVSAQQLEVLTNETIIQLQKNGISPSIIIGKIKTSKANFDVSTNGLIKLKQSNIPDVVVEAIIVAMDKKTVSAVAEETVESGIYYIDKLENITPLDASPIASAKKQNGADFLIPKRGIIGAIYRSKDLLIVDGKNANFQISETRPLFHFVFEGKSSNLNNSAPANQGTWIDKVMNRSIGEGGSADSPNEFILVKMTVREKGREIVTEGSTSIDAGGGLDKKQLVPFKYEKIKDRTYKIIIEQDLSKGEYCFYYSNAIVNQYTAKYVRLKVFDFGIK